MCECKHGKEERTKALREVGSLWEEEDGGGGWPMVDYINTTVIDWRGHRGDTGDG